MTYPTDRPATWFVTGTSRGLGRELVDQLRERGDNVAATSRTADRPGTLQLDLTDEQAVIKAVRATEDRYGPIDVVVNNAGYGFLGAVEEVSDAEARQMFDVQVFGVWNVLRAVLPSFRERRSGHIINVSSILGLTAFPGWGLYCAAKYALEGLTESLAAELDGIQVNLVEPGYTRTDFLRAHSLGLPARTIDGYGAIREMTEAHLAMPGTQLGDPVKVAAAIIQVAVTGNAPLHQLLGSDSYGLAKARVDSLTGDVEAGRELTFTTDV
ncbi:NAD(P)-dependent dehydrogenase (short-subunit alcohol dehydrogenase family) [Actinoplanes tereljensis]|uniref:Short-chain dehydrogenase/reductase n=1 Tax=Paractinoplanes tereljensis TaxID=571912 RepID=A0A919NMV1_9ACTN|nr:SDR family NAD(P)-dependent oxidoreductase [Actinoplanes tereljensis]GIF21030.1 short-chain dehydrogenase/reductase [Actinoplanes tereljensis]